MQKDLNIMKKETWKFIPGYEDLYEVSDLGRVRSLNYNHTGKIRILKTYKVKGYICVGLWKNRKYKLLSVHRLVYETFIGTIPEGMQVNHINEIKTDNRLENLNLMTPKENCNWGTRNQRSADKQRNNHRSQTVRQSTLDGILVKKWPSTKECGRNGFNQGAVAACCRGERKQYKGFIFEYI